VTTWIILTAAAACVTLAALGYRKAFRTKLTRPATLAMWVISVALGGVAGFTGSYSLDERTRVIGFPLPAALFQREPNGVWLDYVGLLTLPFTCANAAVDTGVLLYGAATLLSRFAGVRARGTPAADA
jgi:hypothetical protein